MTYSIDPIGTGFIDSFAHPGGNITGLTSEITAETWGKRLELATRFIPTITHVAVVWNPDVPGMRSGLVATEEPGYWLYIPSAGASVPDNCVGRCVA
jgi:ABC-type uncharacterized transport system substrate-binding protein